MIPAVLEPARAPECPECAGAGVLLVLTDVRTGKDRAVYCPRCGGRGVVR